MNPASLVELADLRVQNERLRRARALRESYGIHFYRPHLKQHRFHEMGQVTGRYSRFGNRTGKTVCGAAEDVAWLRGERSWYKQEFDILGMRKVDGEWERFVAAVHHGTERHPLVTLGLPPRPVKGLLVCADWDKAKEIFTNREGSYEMWGELFQLLPRDSIVDVHKSRGGHIDVITVKHMSGGASVLYLDTVESFKHAWRSAESSDFDFIHYDEPPPQPMFIANKRGLTDRNGKFWINATPVEELWVNDEFTPPGGSNYKVPAEGLEFQKTERGGNRYIITASTFDNPYIGEEPWTVDKWQQGIAEFEASLTREERECRLMGLPLNLAGLIYKEFIYDLHVLADVPKGWKEWHLPPLDYTIRIAWDVHDAIPQAVLFIATAPSGESFIYDELFFSKLIGETATAVKEKLKGRHVADYLIDPRAVIESPVTGESILDELMNFDLFFDKGSKDMELGISKTREKLNERTPQGFPTLWFSPGVAETLHEISRYAYNPRTMKPVDKNDHQLENLRRLVLTGLGWQAPLSEKDYARPSRDIGFNEIGRTMNVQESQVDAEIAERNAAQQAAKKANHRYEQRLLNGKIVFK